MSVSSSRTTDLLHLLWQSPHTPEALAHKTGLSPSGVGEILAALTRAGLPVEEGRLGSVTPAVDPLDPLLISQLLTGGKRFLPSRYHYHPVLESTSSEAVRLARAGAPEGAVVVAQQQTAGRGRQGRVWHSPPGEHLYLSLLLRPLLEPRHAPQLTLLTAVALWETLHEELGLGEVTIKWPNDLLFQGRKVAGILTGMTMEGERVGYGVVGVGVNVHGSAASFPPELAGRVATLAEGLPGGAPPRSLLLVLFLRRFEAWYDRFLREGFSPLRQAWMDHAGTLGRVVRVGTPPHAFQGEALELDLDGFLLVRRESGAVERVMAGEVELVDAPASHLLP